MAFMSSSVFLRLVASAAICRVRGFSLSTSWGLCMSNGVVPVTVIWTCNIAVSSRWFHSPLRSKVARVREAPCSRGVACDYRVLSCYLGWLHLLQVYDLVMVGCRPWAIASGRRRPGCGSTSVVPQTSRPQSVQRHARKAPSWPCRSGMTSISRSSSSHAWLATVVSHCGIARPFRSWHAAATKQLILPAVCVVVVEQALEGGHNGFLHPELIRGTVRHEVILPDPPWIDAAAHR